MNEEAVSVWTLDEELVEPTPEGTSPAPEKTKKDSKESGPAPVEVKGTTSKVEGDLRAVALGAMKSNLFELAPEAVVTEKALSPEDKAYTYRVSIDEFREFRNKAGDFICAIDARMEVLKPDGTPAQPAEEFQFPEGRKNRLTEDDFKQLIARNEVVVDVLDSLDEVASNANADETGMVISFFASLARSGRSGALNSAS
ncbi:MAG: hypothetical protein HC888_07660 [Candidatus Competibacteraceae bacterium]|nr:hypothetical protein [Candidatus Competibacteraceae bacterium]